MNTILSRGAYAISLLKLQALPPPKTGKKLAPINHADFVSAILSVVPKFPNTEQPELSINDDNELMVSCSFDQQHHTDVSFIGINTYRANYPITLLFGTGVSNGHEIIHCPFLEITKKKNESTPQFLEELPQVLSETIGRVNRINELRNTAYANGEISRNNFILLVSNLIIEELIPAHCLQEIVLGWDADCIRHQRINSIAFAMQAIFFNLPVAVIEKHKTRSMMIFAELDRRAGFRAADALNQLSLDL